MDVGCCWRLSQLVLNWDRPLFFVWLSLTYQKPAFAASLVYPDWLPIVFGQSPIAYQVSDHSPRI